MRTLVVGLLVICSMSLMAQNLPSPPVPVASLSGELVVGEFAKDAVVPKKTADSQFWKWSGVSAALDFVDIALTAHCVSGATCRELNPLFGAHPSVGRLVGVSLPLLGAQLASTYYLKKYGNKHWKAGSKAAIATHAIGALTGILNFR